ncbi:hypothetical protein BDR05DRAFT_953053 [Suillus weaverae]|nr:hypothetical protein BDR05DRAFT_953053 [Suillus weaverae]
MIVVVHILQVTQPKPKPLATQIEALWDSDWIDDLFLAELESDEPVAVAPLPSKVLPTDDSITEPESDEPVAAAPLPSKVLPTNDSITEPESEPDNALVPLSTPKPTIMKLCKKWFATLSLHTPGSIYWKYFTREEEACFYDRSGTDKSFQTIQKLRQDLQDSLDNELEK